MYKKAEPTHQISQSGTLILNSKSKKSKFVLKSTDGMAANSAESDQFYCSYSLYKTS